MSSTTKKFTNKKNTPNAILSTQDTSYDTNYSGDITSSISGSLTLSNHFQLVYYAVLFKQQVSCKLKMAFIIPSDMFLFLYFSKLSPSKGFDQLDINRAVFV